MKIITDNAIYVQEKDIAFLNQINSEIPTFTIPAFIFKNDIFISIASSKYEFVEFNAPEEIAYFQSLDWIVDYNEVKDLSEPEIITLGQSITEEKNAIAQKFNSMSSEEKDKNMNLVLQCELLEFKIYSLRDFLWFKQGHIKMELPEGADFPTGFEQKKGLKNLIKTKFARIIGIINHNQ